MNNNSPFDPDGLELEKDDAATRDRVRIGIETRASISLRRRGQCQGKQMTDRGAL